MGEVPLYCDRLLLLDLYQGHQFPAAFAEKLSNWSLKGPNIPRESGLGPKCVLLIFIITLH